jgi:FAD/FMN-containing dehydrogenase
MTFTPSLTTADLAVALVAATRGDVVTAHDPSYPAACFYLATGGVGTILVVTRLLARVSIDPEARTARMGANSSWRQVLAAATPFGLVPVPSPVGSTHRGPRVRTFAFAPDRP